MVQIEPLSVDRVILERIEFAVRHEWSRMQLDDAHAPEIMVERTARALVFQLAMHLFGRRHAGTPVRYPATWWDAFKARWFPRWALRRWPAAYMEITPEALELFPDVIAPRGQRTVMLHQWSGEPRRVLG